MRKLRLMKRKERFTYVECKQAQEDISRCQNGTKKGEG